MVAHVGGDDLAADDDARVGEAQLALGVARTAKRALELQRQRIVHEDGVLLAVAHEELARIVRDALRKGQGAGGGAMGGVERHAAQMRATRRLRPRHAKLLRKPQLTHPRAADLRDEECRRVSRDTGQPGARPSPPCKKARGWPSGVRMTRRWFCVSATHSSPSGSAAMQLGPLKRKPSPSPPLSEPRVRPSSSPPMEKPCSRMALLAPARMPAGRDGDGDVDVDVDERAVDSCDARAVAASLSSCSLRLLGRAFFAFSRSLSCKASCRERYASSASSSIAEQRRATCEHRGCLVLRNHASSTRAMDMRNRTSAAW